MPAPLTQAEKIARGTNKKSRDIAPRPLKQIKRELREVRKTLKDIQFNLREAGDAIRKDGPIIEFPVTDNAGNAHMQKKAHPALKIQKEALAGIKDLKRSLVLLREEEAFALQQKQQQDEFSDFD